MNKKKINLNTKRLKLSRLDKNFLSQEYVNWLNDVDVNKYLENRGLYSIKKLEKYLNNVESKSILFWAIIRKDTMQHIGNIKIDPISELNKTGEYGVLIGDKFSWGKGYAFEASKKVIEYCFNELGLRKITLGVVKDNKGAILLYEKLGFTKEGLYKKHAYHDNQWCDIVRMAIFNPKLNF